jgi:hypothetical protein
MTLITKVEYMNHMHLVLQILRQWIAGGRAETHVDYTNDVQDDWANLVQTYEGNDECGANIKKRGKIYRNQDGYQTNQIDLEELLMTIATRFKRQTKS